MHDISQGLSNIGAVAQDAYGRTASTIRSAVATTQQTAQSALSDAQALGAQIGVTTAGLDATGSSAMSAIMGADIWSKMLFLLVVVLAFLVLVTIGSAIVSAATTYSRDPTLLGNLKPGNEAVVIPQDPRTAHSIPLLRSKNRASGIEFTYSTWIFVDDVPKPQSLPAPMKYHHVFHKGAAGTFSKDGLSQPVNSPGLYIASDATDNGRQHVSLLVVMSTFDDPMETVTIHNIPLNMWVNVVIVVKGQLLDVYVNGTIAGRRTLQGVPMQSYGPLNMSLNGGFHGKMSTTQYFAYALSPVQIANLASQHPSLKEKSGGLANPFPPYLSLRWYTGSSAI